MNPRIRWNPVISREKIRRLYQSEVSGIIDEELLEDVGLALLLRCESILMVSSNRVPCPACDGIFELKPIARRRSSDELHNCPNPDCRWSVTWGEYHKSWTKQRLFGGKAISAFRSYTSAYPAAKDAAKKMIAVDQLLHAFHWDLKMNAPNRLAADNLIDGNHAQVVALLEEISGDSTQQWQETVEHMKKRRSGGRSGQA